MANECDRNPSSDFNPRSLCNPFNPIKRTNNECDRDPIQTINHPSILSHYPLATVSHRFRLLVFPSSTCHPSSHIALPWFLLATSH